MQRRKVTKEKAVSRSSNKDAATNEGLENNTQTNLDSHERIKKLETTQKYPSVISQFDEINGKYEISSKQLQQINNFLKKHKYLYSILKEAKDKILHIFGNKVKMCLKLHYDPEEGWDELFIVIKSPYSPEEAIRLENRLAEEWFLDKIKDTKGKLNIIEEPL